MSVVFTCSIDDGHPLDMKTAALLDKHGLSGTFFVPIHNCEGHEVLQPAQLRELGARFEIGSHTYDHRYLKHVDRWQAYRQIAAGKKELEDALGREVTGFCYPGGRYRSRDVKLVRACGFRYARTTVNLCFHAGSNPYEMPTSVQFYPHGRAVYLRNFASGGHWWRRHDGLRLAMLHADWTRRLHAMFEHVCGHGGVFHLWGHSVQFEELGIWHELDGFFAHVASRVARPDCISNAELVARAFAPTATLTDPVPAARIE